MSAEKEGSPQTEKSIWEIYNQELCLWIQFMKAIYGVNLQPVPASGNMYIPDEEKERVLKQIPSTGLLDSSGNFLETQITSVMALSKEGKEVSPTNNDEKGDVTFAETPAKAIAYLGYIKMEYQSQGPEKFQATGFKYDYNNAEQADKAMRERTCAALSLAYAAKAKGWKKVNFDNTEDPIDRIVLMKACEYVGISCANEQSFTSAPMRKSIPLTQSLLDGALTNKAVIKDGMSNEQRIDAKISAIETNIVGYMATFIRTKELPLEGAQKPSASPSVKVMVETPATKVEINDEAAFHLFA